PGRREQPAHESLSSRATLAEVPLTGLSFKAQWSGLSMKMLDSGDVSDHPYQAQFKAFFDALDKGQDMPLTSFRHALRTFKVIFAADQSAANGGQPVKVA
ncbi:MAG: hypothetical protein WCJ41_22125, partial [Aestuariivirga sp.]|uniref:hypothetical protein n=1 Tax=Aestuariivirga sp. TaxID=2650926 RepID=UPI003015B59C